MSVLHRSEIEKLMANEESDRLQIEPLLEQSQVDEMGIDLRLGYDFLVSIVTRQPSISLSKLSNGGRSVASYFQETRRDIGSTFVLYPNQVVLATTLEYVALPSNVYANIISRSSITRLGIHISTMLQAGFRGCVPLELFNHGNNAVELVVGGRICQLQFTRLAIPSGYTRSPRKYYGDVRPTVSKADKDSELSILSRLAH